ncbi:MAG: hypothetical protein J6N77_06600 [Lachnospiraceae bacterium]|nr:hypothetical protein [Lachnospiraceae bacterium]
MFRLWAKEWKNGHMQRDTVIEIPDADLSRTKKVFSALEETCHQFDLQVPIWLDSNIRDFQRVAKTRFTRDSFIEEIPFDYLEIQVIEEDDLW